MFSSTLNYRCYICRITWRSPEPLTATCTCGGITTCWGWWRRLTPDRSSPCTPRWGTDSSSPAARRGREWQQLSPDYIWQASSHQLNVCVCVCVCVCVSGRRRAGPWSSGTKRWNAVERSSWRRDSRWSASDLSAEERWEPSIVTFIPRWSSSLRPPHLPPPPLCPQGKILVGTKDGEIIEVGEKNAASNLLLDSHARGGIWGLTAHPAKDLCITASDDATIRLWDLTDKAHTHTHTHTRTYTHAGYLMAVNVFSLSLCRNCWTKCVSVTQPGVWATVQTERCWRWGWRTASSSSSSPTRWRCGRRNETAAPPSRTSGGRDRERTNRRHETHKYTNTKQTRQKETRQKTKTSFVCVCAGSVRTGGCWRSVLWRAQWMFTMWAEVRVWTGSCTAATSRLSSCSSTSLLTAAIYRYTHTHTHTHTCTQVYTHILIYILLTVCQVSTGVYKRQVFELPSAKLVSDQTIIDRITWATWTR